MVDLPDGLKAEANKFSSTVANIIVGQAMARGTHEWEGSLPGTKPMTESLPQLAQQENIVGQAFRAQLRALRPGGLSAAEVEKVIKDPAAQDNAKLIERIVSDRTFQPIVQDAIGYSGMINNVQAEVLEGQLNPQRDRSAAQKYTQLTQSGNSPEQAVASVAQGNEEIYKLSAVDIKKAALTVERNTLLKRDKTGTLDATQEARLVELNRDLYKMYENDAKARNDKPLSEASYNDFMGSKKYKKEHAYKPGSDDVGMSTSDSSKALAMAEASSGISARNLTGAQDQSLASSEKTSVSPQGTPLSTGAARYM